MIDVRCLDNIDAMLVLTLCCSGNLVISMGDFTQLIENVQRRFPMLRANDLWVSAPLTISTERVSRFIECKVNAKHSDDGATQSL